MFRAKLRRSVRLALLEAVEPRLLMSASIESIDGTGNNLAHTTWGSAGIDLIRLAKAAYSDGISTPALASDASARAISNILNNQADPANPAVDIATVDQNSVSDFGYAFGQFMDHDLDLTPDGQEWMPIDVAATDPMGPDPIPFTRSQYDTATGTSTSNPRQQVTTVTSYFDLSQVYGSSTIVANALRTFVGGQLKTSPGNMLPYDNTTYFTTDQIAALNMANDAQAVPESSLFAAGDRRANENLELTTLQTLFMRNHNLIASQLQKLHPGWSDEQLYQEARKINIAEYQSIVYNEWIPAVLGQSALPAYRGYNPGVNATIANEFSTVAFRFGHSMVSPEIERQNNDGTDIATVNPAGADISLAQDFFDPNLLNPAGVVDPLTNQTSSDIGAILKAEADGDGQAMDLMAINDIRNLLFSNGGLGGDDLMARDVQRDRDNGIPNYNALRTALGLKPVTSFAQITSDKTVQAELAAAYPGGVNTIDAFEGGLAEDHVRGSDVGPLFQAIMANQFQRLRDGDRFFYMNESWTREELSFFQQGNTLAEVIKANTNITNLQSDVFIYQASISGTVAIGGLISPNHRPVPPMGLPGITVQLVDADGDVVAITHTDRAGNYILTQLSTGNTDVEDSPGLSATGSYKVVLALPTSLKLVSPLPSTIVITRSDTNVRNVNFLVGPVNPAAAVSSPLASAIGQAWWWL